MADTFTVWRWIDDERADLADLLDTFTTDQWATESLCAGWTVRDVAAHLTHSHVGITSMVTAVLRSGFRFDSMMRHLVASDVRSPAEVTAALRGIVGSRRRPPMTTALDPLMDLVIHGQDIAIPLGVDRPMPVPAATAVAEHMWRMRFPFNPSRDLRGFRLIADDAEFAAGTGHEVRAPIRELVLVLGRRRAPESVTPGATPA